jgi:hypothetical protein
MKTPALGALGPDFGNIVFEQYLQAKGTSLCWQQISRQWREPVELLSDNNANVVHLSSELSAPEAPKVRVTEMKPSRKPNALVDASIQIAFGSHTIDIADFRVLRNRQGGLWCAAPAYAISSGGRSFEYFPTASFSTALKRLIEDTVLAEFDKWQHQQPSAAFATGGVR